MKIIIFVLLLIVNVAYGVGTQLPSSKKNTAAMESFNSEKIVLLQVDKNCVEWGKFYEEQIQYSEAMISEIVSDQSCCVL